MKFYLLYYVVSDGDENFLCMCEDKVILRKEVEKQVGRYLYIVEVSKDENDKVYKKIRSHGFSYDDRESSGIWEKESLTMDQDKDVTCDECDGEGSYDIATMGGELSHCTCYGCHGKKTKKLSEILKSKEWAKNYKG